MNKVLFSSNYDSWRTPNDLFNSLDQEFHFSIDACADDSNKLCSKYFTKENSFLNNFPTNEVIYCNPPYSRNLGKFIQHCSYLRLYNNIIVILVPSRTDTRWFHEYCYNQYGVEIRFIKGRVNFGGPNSYKCGALFPSMIVIMRPIQL